MIDFDEAIRLSLELARPLGAETVPVARWPRPTCWCAGAPGTPAAAAGDEVEALRF